MKVFITWSGETSRSVAMALHKWLPSVIQCLKPYVSERDLQKGTRWAASLGHELEHTEFGIACVTPDSVEEPWLHFEAGAISKRVDESRLSPFLVGLGKSDLFGPLAQFQVTEATRDDVLELMRSLNANVETPLEATHLTNAFDKFWPDLEEKLERIKSEIDQAAESDGDAPETMSQEKRDRILEEILEIVRAQRRATSPRRRESSGRSSMPGWMVDRGTRIQVTDSRADYAEVALANDPARDLLRLLLDIGRGKAIAQGNYSAFFTSDGVVAPPLGEWFLEREKGILISPIAQGLARNLVPIMDPDTIEGVDQVAVNTETGALEWRGKTSGAINPG